VAEAFTSSKMKTTKDNASDHTERYHQQTTGHAYDDVSSHVHRSTLHAFYISIQVVYSTDIAVIMFQFNGYLEPCRSDLYTVPWRRDEFESGKWEGGHRKTFFGRAPPLFGSKSTIHRCGERFRDGQYSLLSFLFAVLLLTVTVPPCPAICKSGEGARAPVPPWSRRHWLFIRKYLDL